jgi:cytochrome oxidase Cu insertion factor (SCO1/SenC/PrrC family)
VCLVVLAFAAAPARQAAADGDPASDVLLGQRMFVPTDADATVAEQSRLGALLRSAEQAGFPIRVAVIPSDYDLGSVTALWHKPRLYARFLAVELSNVYRGALLVAMPNGFGIHLPRGNTGAADRRVARIRIGSGAGVLLTSTDAAVRALAASDGTSISATAGGSSTDAGAVAGALAAVLLVLAFGALAVRRRSALASSWRAVAHGAAAVAVPRSRVLVGGLIGGLSIAAAAAILGIELDRGNATPRPTPGQPSQVAPFRFAANKHAAPTFQLHDQNGRPVSLAAYRGRPVIVTFIDPLCRNLCPLAAHVLNEMDRQLPASRRIPIVAVSVDIYADSRADLLQDYSRWALVPQWHWAVGTPRQLAAVWNDYGIGVIVQTKHIAGTTVHFISHYEVAYVVDGTGYLRALYLWPYYPSQVERELAAISQN